MMRTLMDLLFSRAKVGVWNIVQGGGALECSIIAALDKAWIPRIKWTCHRRRWMFICRQAYDRRILRKRLYKVLPQPESIMKAVRSLQRSKCLLDPIQEKKEFTL